MYKPDEALLFGFALIESIRDAFPVERRPRFGFGLCERLIDGRNDRVDGLLGPAGIRDVSREAESAAEMPQASKLDNGTVASRRSFRERVGSLKTSIERSACSGAAVAPTSNEAKVV